MAVVVPFPSVRQPDRIRRAASYLTACTPAQAEAYRRQMRRNTIERFRRAAVADDLIEADISALEAAVAVELWRRVLMPEGAA